MRRQSVGQIGNGFNAVGASGGDQRHVAVTDLGTGPILVVERAGEIADRYDQRLLDQVRIERHPGLFVELGQPRPLVNDEGQWLPQ